MNQPTCTNDETVLKIGRLEFQVIQLSAMCVQQHVELKQLRTYLDPQHDALSVIGMSFITFFRALAALVIQPMAPLLKAARRPQATRVKHHGH
jgi:hypothetical protein